MLKSRFPLVLMTSALILGLAACDTTPVNKAKLMTASHFWQRTDATSAIWQRGPKAQQMLQRDISRCVTEIRELERLGAIRTALPGDTGKDGSVPNPHTPEGNMAQWESPMRDGYLRAELRDYQDFESCMYAKGWERIEYVPYDVAEEGRDDYLEAIAGEQYQTRTRQRETPFKAEPGDFESLNE